jgi:hypothetical protein
VKEISPVRLSIAATSPNSANKFVMGLGQEIVRSAGAESPLHSIMHCVLYDPHSGDIRHQHRVLTVFGAIEPSEDEVVADARRLAAQSAPSRELMALLLPPGVMEADHCYRVDVGQKTLVKLSEN